MPGAPSERTRRRLAAIGAAIVVALGYAGAVVWLTWPLASLATTHFPKTMMTALLDVPLLMWALAHESRALLDPASFGHAGIYHPTPYALFYGEAALGALPLFAPVFLATGNPVLAVDFLFLAGVAMTATMLHAAAQRWSGSHLGGVVAGTTFLATPWVLWGWVTIAPNYAVLFYVPAIMVLAARLVPQWRPTMRLGALIAIQGLTSAYVAAAVFAPLGALGLAHCVRRGTRRTGVALLLALAMASVVLAVAFAGHVIVHAQNPNIASQSPYAGMATLRFDDIPSMFREPVRPTCVPLVSLGLIVLGGLFRLWTPRHPDDPDTGTGWRHCFLWIGVGLYVSLAPSVSVFGYVFSPPRIVPSAVYQALRASDRLTIATLMGACVLAGLSFVELTRRLPRRFARIGSLVLAAVVLGTMYVGYAQPVPLLGVTRRPLDEPYPTLRTIPPTGKIEAALRRLPGPLLELPIGPTGMVAADAMMRSIYHRHPLLNGYDGYWPQDFPRRMALACRLPDRDALTELVDATGVELILVHLMSLDGSRQHGAGMSRCPRDPRRDQAPQGSESREWIAVATDGTRTDLRLVAREGDQLLFRVMMDRPARP